MKEFHISQIISVYTGVLIPTPGTKYAIDGVYEILDYMVGESLQTVQLPRVAKECRPYLREEFPWLEQIQSGIVLAGVNEQNWPEALEMWVKMYGAFHDVRPIHAEDHENLHPIEDLRRINPVVGVITIDLTEEDEPPTYGDIGWKSED